MSVKGCVTICVELQGLLSGLEFVVVYDLIYPIILDLDFISTKSIKLESTPGRIMQKHCVCIVESVKNDDQTDVEFFLTSVDLNRFVYLKFL